MPREAELISEREREREELALILQSNPRITLKEIACLTGTERHKIQRTIKKQYGCSFKGLRKAIRLKCARALLRDERRRYSVKEIASELGLTPNYLSRLFKSMTGKCPTELRRL